jgi:hypothetical protein
VSHHFDSAADRADGRINPCDLYAFPAARHGTTGTRLGQGHTCEVFSLGGGGLAWAGPAADPFNGDGIAIGRFLQGLAEGRYTPEVFTAAPSNTFAGRDVTAIALQLPDAALGSTRIAPVGTDQAPTATARIAATAARLAGLPDPDGHAARVAAAFLPDVVGYRPGRPARFYPGDGNGRALGDDAYDIAVAVLAGATLGSAAAPRQATPAFPYLSAPSRPSCPPGRLLPMTVSINPMRLRMRAADMLWKPIPPLDVERGALTEGPAGLQALGNRCGQGASVMEALRWPSTELAGGSFTAVMGPARSGASMLVNCVADLETPTHPGRCGWAMSRSPASPGRPARSLDRNASCSSSNPSSWPPRRRRPDMVPVRCWPAGSRAANARERATVSVRLLVEATPSARPGTSPVWVDRRVS